jgi:hypothetical protein
MVTEIAKSVTRFVSKGQFGTEMVTVLAIFVTNIVPE